MAAIIITKDTALTQKVIDVIKTIYDPEIPVDIWELGLIYEININEEKDLLLRFTLTSPAEMETKLKDLPELKSVKLELTFEPTWEKDMMSDVAQVELGFM
jgi:metal-sulfur cluster biosynthetic enzyme